MVGRRHVIETLLLGAFVGTRGISAPQAAAASATEVVVDTWFGVKGDGKTNDKANLQNAVDRSVGKTLLITGQSRIDASGLDMRTGSHLRFAPNASIKLLAHNEVFYQMLRIWDVRKVVLENATLDGSKELNSAKKDPAQGGYGMGISIAGSSDVAILSTATVNCWGDGIYIANSYAQKDKCSSAIRVIDHRASRCRRQGVSIISGRDVLFENPLWENIGGTDPSAGLDIEPNSNQDVLENIRIVSPTTRNCRTGILVYLKEIPGPIAKNVQVEISNHRDESSTDAAFSVSGLQTEGHVVTGRIVSFSPTWVNPRLAEVKSVGYDNAGPAIVVTGRRLVP
jgi:hypothetical protein